MTGLSPDDQHDAMIDELIIQHADAGALDALACALPGIYPTEIIRRLPAIESRLPADGLAELQRYSRQAAHLEALKSVLPLPHPLDFEWRFAHTSCAWLLDRAVGGRPASRVALLGTPGLAEQSLHRRGREEEVVLFEKRPEACVALEHAGLTSTVCCDLAFADLAEHGTFQAVVADPPWYPSVMDVFVRAASELLVPGGLLHLCSPGIGTRPTVPAERFKLMEFCYEQGFVSCEILQGALAYESPPFEVSALTAAGLPDFCTTWRRGDILTFLKVGEVAPFEADTDLAEPSPWKEVSVGQSRVRIRPPTEDTPRRSYLSSVVEGDVLDSVSRRDRRREHPNVWTSTNHVYCTDYPDQLMAALQSLTNGSMASTLPGEALTAAKTIIEGESASLRTMM